jgi:hypothetical protein
MIMRKRETLDEFTDRAIAATDAGKFIPPIVYLPKRLRANGVRLTVDNICVTTNPPTIKENHLRILDADPLGFLMAVMHGQPIPSFHVTTEGSIRVEYQVPCFDTRVQTAKWLAHKVTLRSNDHKSGIPVDEGDGWNDLVEKRNAKERETNNNP